MTVGRKRTGRTAVADPEPITVPEAEEEGRTIVADSIEDAMEQVSDQAEDIVRDARAALGVDDMPNEDAAEEDRLSIPVKLTFTDGREIPLSKLTWELKKTSAEWKLGEAGIPEKGRSVELSLRATVEDYGVDPESGTFTLLLAKERVTGFRLVPKATEQPSLFDRGGDAIPVDAQAILREHLAQCDDCTKSDWGSVLTPCPVYSELDAKYPRPEANEAEDSTEEEKTGADASDVSSSAPSATAPGDDSVPSGADPAPTFPGQECTCSHVRLKHREGEGPCAEIVEPGHPNRYCDCTSFDLADADETESALD
jgi:hypothetical protein